MNSSQAHSLLDAAKAGQTVAPLWIAHALQATGDLPRDWPKSVVMPDPLERPAQAWWQEREPA